MAKLVSILFRVVLVLVIIAVAAVGTLYGLGASKLGKRPTNPMPDLTVVPDSALQERGQHIAELICVGCHGNSYQFPLAGSTENFAKITDGPYLGELFASNITPGGALAHYTSDGALARAIREGVGYDGRVLVAMPSPQFHTLSDADLHALIVFLRAQRPVLHDTPKRRINPLGLMMLGAGIFETSLQPPLTAPVPSVPEDSTAAYGDYLTRLAACRDCHGPELLGAPSTSLAPHGPDLVALATAHPAPIVTRALRGGIGADGRALNPAMMPFPVYSKFSDLEAQAIYVYLKSRATAGS